MQNLTQFDNSIPPTARSFLTNLNQSRGMSRFVLFLFFSVFCLALPAQAEPFRLFGRSYDRSLAVYGSFIAPPGVTESPTENAKFELYIKPSITLRKLSDKTSLVAYAIVAFLGDSEGFTYNNKVTFALGTEIQYQLSKAVRLSFGSQWKMEREFSTGTLRSAFILTADASVYKTWKPDWLKHRQGTELVLSGWANYRGPGSLHDSERKNGQLQASFKLAVVMPYRETKLKFAPFISVMAKADQLGRAFNNTFEPAIGLDLKIPISGGGSIAVGAKTAHQIRHATGTAQTGTSAYVTWYKRF